jgi:hypothetical protein
MANNIAVSITADVADLSVKRAIMSAELKAATKDLNTFAKEAAGGANTEALREGMLASAVAAEQARAKISLVNTELKEMAAVATPAVHEAERGFAALSATISESGVKLRETLGEMGELREAAMAFGELLIAAFAVEAIERFADKLGEAAEHTKHVSEQMGLTVKQTQGLQAAATAVGVPFDKLVTGLGLIDKKFETDPKLFKQLGILLPQNATQMQILEATMDRFQGLENGPQKTALALTIMGRAGKEMIPFLNEGSKGLEELLGKAEKYGAVSQDASDKGVALAEAINEGKVASMGLSNTMTSALGPILTSMVSGFSDMVAAITASYNAGGTVKVVFEAVAEVMSGIGEILLTVGDAFKTLFGTTGVSAQDWGSVIKFVIDEVVIVIKILITSAELVGLAFKVIFESMAADAVRWYGDTREMFQRAGLALTILGDDFKTLGKVAIDALTLSWGSIAADWDAGMRQIDNVVKSRGAQIIADAPNIKNTAKALLEAAASDKAKGDALLNTDLTKRHAGPSETGVKEGEGTRGGEVDLEHHGKAPKAKKPPKEKDLTLQTWRTELSDMLAAEANWGADSNELSLKFWQEKLAQTAKGSKDELEIRREVNKLKLAIFKQEQADTVAALKAVETIRMEDAKTEIDLAKIGLQEKIALIDDAQSAGRISATRAQSERNKLNAQLYALDADLENKEFLIKKAGLDAQINLEHQSEEKKNALRLQELTLTKQHEDKIVLLNAQKNQKIAADDQKLLQTERQKYQQFANAWGDSLAKMATFQQGFMTTVGQMWQTVVGVAQRAISQMVSDWIVGMLTKEAVSKAADRKEVTRDAMAAARGAYKALVQIPVIGPILAPIGAAVAFTAVSAFSAEGGMDNVPYDNAPFLLHKNEMVLPASLATPLRSMVSGANDNASGGFGGTTHNHYYIQALDGHSVKRVLMDNSGHVAAAAHDGYRKGSRPMAAGR